MTLRSAHTFLGAAIVALAVLALAVPMNEAIEPQFRSLDSPNKMVSAANGVDYAFRELGDDSPAGSSALGPSKPERISSPAIVGPAV